MPFRRRFSNLAPALPSGRARRVWPCVESRRARGRSYLLPQSRLARLPTPFQSSLIFVRLAASPLKETSVLPWVCSIPASTWRMRTRPLAMNPAAAGLIMSVGMTEGWFTGKKLGDYFNDKLTDWTNARRIINGTDQAALIASYAKTIYAVMPKG